MVLQNIGTNLHVYIKMCMHEQLLIYIMYMYIGRLGHPECLFAVYSENMHATSADLFENVLDTFTVLFITKRYLNH